MGTVIKTLDMSSYQEMMKEAQLHFEEEAHQQETLSESKAFSLVYAAKKYDDYLLDPAIGFFIPAFGDMLSSLVTFPALYVAIFKLKSLKLTVAIFYVMAIDLLCGLVPVVGDMVDIFHKSNKIACRLIVGYMEKDPETMKEINKKATWGIVWLVVLGCIIYCLLTMLSSVAHSISHWFSS